MYGHTISRYATCTSAISIDYQPPEAPTCKSAMQGEPAFLVGSAVLHLQECIRVRLRLITLCTGAHQGMETLFFTE